MLVTEDRFRAMLGMTLFLLLLVLFFGRVWSTRDTASARLYSAQNPAALSESQIGQKLGAFRHTQYVLIDGEGDILAEWNGYLNQEQVAIVMDAALVER